MKVLIDFYNTSPILIENVITITKSPVQLFIEYDKKDIYAYSKVYSNELIRKVVVS